MYVRKCDCVRAVANCNQPCAWNCKKLFSNFNTIIVVQSLQLPNGSFMGDKWGEIDTRFSYCALNCLSLLGYYNKLETVIDLEKAVDFVLKCQNFDGGFGAVPGAESHAGQSMCAFFFKIETIVSRKK